MIHFVGRTQVIGLLVLFLWAAPAALFADQKVDETRKFSADGTVLINNISGSIEVVGTDKKEVHVEGTLGDGVEELKIEEKSGRLTIKVVYPEKGTRADASHIRVHLPKGCEVHANAVSADVNVSGLEGEVEISVVSGEVIVKGEPKALDLETVSGSVTVEEGAGSVEAASVSGDIGISGARGKVSAETVSGDIEVIGKGVEELRAETVSGDVLFRGSFTKKGSCKISAHSGDITLLLPGGIEADVEAGTFSGSIDSDFGSSNYKEKEFLSAVSLSFVLGSGDVRIRLETFSGDISIEKE
jgi:DUF4097 and DUF4098 domain-containing protein YvlB